MSTNAHIEAAATDPSDLSDLFLVERIRASETTKVEANRAFGALYERHWSLALAQARRLMRDERAAEDVASEAFFKTFQAIRNGSGPTSSFLGYLLTAVRTESLRFNPTDASTIAAPIEDIDETLTQTAHAADHQVAERDRLERALFDLPETWRRVLWLVEIEDVSLRESARYLEMNESSLRALLYRAREGLRTSYLQQYVERSNESCGEIPALLAKHIRGKLAKRKRQLVADHLERCVDCAGESSKLSRLNEQLRSWAGLLFVGGAIGTGLVASGNGSPSASAALSPAARKWFLVGVSASIALTVGGIVSIVVAGTGAYVPDSPVQPVADVEDSPEHDGARGTDSGTDGSSEGNTGTRADPERSGNDRSDDSTLQGAKEDVWEDDQTPFWKLR